MGGGSDDGYTAMQLALQKEQLEVAKQALVEPAKTVDSVKEAKDSTIKEQELRRGLASAFSRSGVGSKSATGATATSGSAGKLGD